MGKPDIVLSQQQARSDARALALVDRDRRLAQYTPELVESGDVEGRSRAELSDAALAGAPRLVFDLVVTCHKNGCGTELQALSYHAFVNESRFMLWIEGKCPTCMERRKTVFDPMVGMQAKLKLEAEQEELCRTLMAELAGDADDEQEVAGAA